MALTVRGRSKSTRSDSFISDVLKEFETRQRQGSDTGGVGLSEKSLLCESGSMPVWQKLNNLTKAKHKLVPDFLYQRISHLPREKSEEDESEEVNVKYLPLTFIPNFIIEEILSDPDAIRSVPLNLRSHAVLVMVDVSGFTPLTEMYNRKEHSGAADLAAELNTFMSNLASTLMSFGGDILNFAGDAFLCQWEGKREADLCAMSEQAYSCAVYIQTILSSDVRHVLRVKIGMALGETKTQILGSPSEFLLFAVYGKALVTVRCAEELCGPSEIVISEDVFYCLKEQDIKIEGEQYLENGFIKISGFERELESKPLLNYSSRTQLFEECTPQIIALTRAFMIPILRDVKTIDELKYLSEVSEITILFVFLPSIDVENPVNLDHALENILSSVKNFGGVLNKVLLFDKGCTFLAIFGLPGLKHLNDACRSLLCAENIVEKLKQYNLEISTGLSSGTCFCGIIGHQRRQEFTVLGWRVNMACRLMTTYSDYQIVLDADTYQLSYQELGANCFTELQKRKLKGIEDVPKIYSYNPHAKFQPDVAPSVYLNIEYAADKEYMKLHRILSSLKSNEIQADIRKSNKLPVIIIEGEKASGKSFFLYRTTEIAATLDYQIVSCCATPRYVNEPFVTISKILKKFFDILSEAGMTKEEVVLSFLPNMNDPYICCLNHLLKVQFPIRQNFCIQFAAVNQNIRRLLKAIISKICRSDLENPLLIAIDDSENMDVFSWYLLKDLLQSENIVVLLSKTTNSKILCSTTPYIHMHAYHHINLGIFFEILLVPMVCWFLNVHAVHQDIMNFLKIHVSNDSQLLEEILLSPVFVRSTKILPLSLLTSKSVEQMVGIIDTKNSESDFIEHTVCDMRSGVDLHKSLLCRNFEGAIKERLNNLRIQSRVILKRAAVLGYSFYFHLLEAANSDLTREELIESISALVEQNILRCDSISPVFVPKKHPVLIRLLSGSGYVSSKVMSSEKSPKELHFLPFQKLQFTCIAFRTYMLQRMTKDQATSMHLEVVKQLQNEGLVCQECKTEQSSFKKKVSFGLEDARRGSLQLPSLDLRKCCCPLYMANAYSRISSIYAAIGSDFNSIVFLVKAAEAYLHLNEPVKALAYLQFGTNRFTPAFFRSDLPKADLEIHPLVIKASLFRVRAEILSHLQNSYDAANSAIEALKFLGISIIEFFGQVTHRHLLKIAQKCSDSQQKEVIRCLSVICKSYYHAGDYKTAYHLADCLIHFIPKSYDISCDAILYKVLFYRCKSMYNPLTIDAYLEHTLLHLCHGLLMYSPNPVGFLDIRAVAKAYVALIGCNLNLGKLSRATAICSEAVRLLKSVHENAVMPHILAFGIRACLHSKRFGYILTYLNNLRSISVESGNKIYLGMFYCSIIEMSGSKTAQATLGDRLIDFNNFVQTYDPTTFIMHEPRDMAYFIAARFALWCLEIKLVTEETKWVETFLYWYSLAELLKCKSTGSYWLIGAHLSMIRINIVLHFRIKNLTVEEKELKFQELENELRSMMFSVKANYPVFDNTFEDLICDLISTMPEATEDHKGVRKFFERFFWFEQLGSVL